MTNLILHGGTIVTIGRERDIIEDGAVVTSGDRIVAVGSSRDLLARYPQAERIDCTGRLIIPGLIDAHGHAGHSLIKTLASDSYLQWMRIMTPVYFHYVTREFWLADGYLSALERLYAGVTTGVSIMGSMPRSDDPVFSVNHARGYADVGLREILCVGPAGLPWPREVTRWDSGRPARHLVDFDAMIAGAEAVIEACNGTADGRILAYLTPFTIVPSVETSNPTPPDRAVRLTDEDRMQARRIREVARRHAVRIHSDAFGGMVRMAMQDRENALLGPDVHLQHCRGLSLDEVDILAETGTHVGHSPGGAAPVLAMLSKGVNVAITTDGTAPRRSFDMLQAARQVHLAHQVLNADFYLLPPGKLLEMITIDAARALGLEAEIGSIEVGKKADLVVVDMRKPHLTPNYMVVHRLLFEAVGSDVDTVIVNGKVLMRDRKVLTVDVEAALRNAEEEASALIRRAGLETHLTGPGWGQISRTFDAPVKLTEPPEVQS